MARLSDLTGAGPHLGRWLGLTASLALGAAAGLWGSALWPTRHDSPRVQRPPVPALAVAGPRAPDAALVARLDRLAARLDDFTPTDVVLDEDAWNACAALADELDDLAAHASDRASRERARALAIHAHALLTATGSGHEPENPTH